MNNEVIPMTKLKGKLGTIRHNILNVFRLRGWSNKIRINQEIYFVGSPRFLKFPDFKNGPNSLSFLTYEIMNKFKKIC